MFAHTNENERRWEHTAIAAYDLKLRAFQVGLVLASRSLRLDSALML
jgi:hypothetical protein